MKGLGGLMGTLLKWTPFPSRAVIEPAKIIPSCLFPTRGMCLKRFDSDTRTLALLSHSQGSHILADKVAKEQFMIAPSNQVNSSMADEVNSTMANKVAKEKFMIAPSNQVNSNIADVVNSTMANKVAKE